MTKDTQQSLTLAIAGLGAIGMRVAAAVDRGEVPGIRLTAVSANDRARAAERLGGLACAPAVVTLPELAGLADIVVECAPAAAFHEIAVPAVEAGRIFIPLSCGALLNHPDLPARAAETGQPCPLGRAGVRKADSHTARDGHRNQTLGGVLLDQCFASDPALERDGDPPSRIRSENRGWSESSRD